MIYSDNDLYLFSKHTRWAYQYNKDLKIINFNVENSFSNMF